MDIHLVTTLTGVLPASVPAGLAVAYAARHLAQSQRPRVVVTIAECAALGVWAALVMPTAPLIAISCALAWILFLLGLVDALAFRLPDIVTLPLLVVGVAIAWWLPDHDVFGHVIAAFVGAAVFYGISIAYRQTRGQDGLGMGDAKLAGAAGAWLGWQALPYVVLLACAGGFVWVGLAVMLRGKDALRERIPFGVALCFAIWIIWLYGTPDFAGSLSA
ncbi:MAG TPA: A24 family peptidase [Rhizomicrobium sp.]|nr:A24 family peptidase [Rhizomicrobium sp.]